MHSRLGNLALWCLASVILARVTFSRNSFWWREVPEWRDKLATGDYLWRLNVRSKVVCSYYCLQERSCQSFFYQSSTRRCQGHSRVFLALSDTSSQDSADSVYYKIACEGGSSYQYDRSINTCYSLKELRTSWYKAQAHCQSEKAWLLDLGDQQMAENFMRKFNNYHDPFLKYFWFWLGLTDSHLEGNYIWHHSSTPLNGSVKWLPGEPDNANKGQHCVYMRFQDGRFQWGDIECTAEFIEFICQSYVL